MTSAAKRPETEGEGAEMRGDKRGKGREVDATGGKAQRGRGVEAELNPRCEGPRRGVGKEENGAKKGKGGRRGGRRRRKNGKTHGRDGNGQTDRQRTSRQAVGPKEGRAGGRTENRGADERTNGKNTRDTLIHKQYPVSRTNKRKP